MEKAVFGAGCFWGPEAQFSALPGVVETEVGYMGGTTENPTDRDIYDKRTGHTEVVQVKFDSAIICYADLVEKFFAIHDPTQMNRQGPDIGDQYRSVIFYLSPEQEHAAREIKERLEKSGQYKRPIVTAIEPASTFWRAEEHHQKWYAKKGGGSCRI